MVRPPFALITIVNKSFCQLWSIARFNMWWLSWLSSRSELASVAVSKLVSGKTGFVFVQPGAKINSVYYCENVLEQVLLPAFYRILNNNFVFQRLRIPAGWSTCALFTPHCYLAGFHWTERLISCQKDWQWLSRQRVIMLNLVNMC